nr:hypothetical protein [Tanacetum cinerariifolium]
MVFLSSSRVGLRLRCDYSLSWCRGKRSPNLDLMKPFGCLVTILNTLDHLGKFKGKVDEGFLVGYSVNITAGNQTNNDASIEINFNVGKARQEKASDHEYILLPFIPLSIQSLDDKDVGEVPDKGDEGVSKGSDIDDQEKTNSNTQDVDTTEPNLPNGKRAIGTKWVFRNKKNESGIIVRNKARLVAQGYTQEEGIDYDEVFAFVARIEAIRIFLAYASFMGFIVYQMDVKSVFLYGTIEEELYVCQPPGFENLHVPNNVYKDKGDILLVQVYVDDIIFGSTKKSLCDEFEQMMHKRFQMSSMGELTFFLGLQVKQKDNGIFISQDKYVADNLKKFDFTTVKTTSTLMELNKTLIKDAEAEDLLAFDYFISKEVFVRCLIWFDDDTSIEFGVTTCYYRLNAARLDLVLLSKIEGKGSGQPSEPQPPSSTTPPEQVLAAISQPQKTHTPRRTKRGRDTEIPQSSGSPKKVGNEAIYTRKDDRVVRDATTAASLEAEQENSNINKTQPTTTLNEPSPQGTGSSSGPMCHVTTLGDTDAQTRIVQDCSRLGDQKVEKESQKIGKEAKGKNSRDEALQDWVKKKVKRLEKKQRARTLGMKLFKIGTSKKKTLDKENVAKHGRDESNRTEELNLSDKGSGKTKVFDYTTAAEKDGNVAEPVSTTGDAVYGASVIHDVSVFGPSTSATGPSISTTKDIFEDEMTTIADILMAIRRTRPRTTSVVIHNVEEEPRRATPPPIVRS